MYKERAPQKAAEANALAEKEEAEADELEATAEATRQELEEARAGLAVAEAEEDEHKMKTLNLLVKTKEAVLGVQEKQGNQERREARIVHTKRPLKLTHNDCKILYRTHKTTHTLLSFKTNFLSKVGCTFLTSVVDNHDCGAAAYGSDEVINNIYL